ncbi:uncharacterized protein LOC107874388 [Capsicum annuum]|uniref:uncharacterized protein LOC107874388 n=1 Tax=Capsicum annuum TaxID=4072 RepID=UPI0007BF7BE7|nr:uncharacterized protein LOC107874388 [Capsicum annuum]
MAPFEALYERRCRFPVRWFEVGEATVIGPNAVFEAMEKVKLIQERVLQRVEKAAYEIELPAELSAAHPVFHVSMFKKHIGDSVVVDHSERFDVKDSLSYDEVLAEILDYQVRRLRIKEVPLIKDLWQNKFVEGDTREAEVDIRAR